jgi:hypothetical protein
MPPKRTKQSSITSMDFLFFRSSQRCVWADRSRFLDPTGKDTCQMKNRIHCTCSLFAIIMRCTSGMQVVHPLKQWNCRRWTWMDRTTEKPAARTDGCGWTVQTSPSTPISVESIHALSIHTHLRKFESFTQRQHWYGTFPPVQQDTTTTGTSDISPPSVCVHTDCLIPYCHKDIRLEVKNLPESLKFKDREISVEHIDS